MYNKTDFENTRRFSIVKINAQNVNFIWSVIRVNRLRTPL